MYDFNLIQAIIRASNNGFTAQEISFTFGINLYDVLDIIEAVQAEVV